LCRHQWANRWVPPREKLWGSRSGQAVQGAEGRVRLLRRHSNGPTRNEPNPHTGYYASQSRSRSQSRADGIGGYYRGARNRAGCDHRDRSIRGEPCRRSGCLDPKTPCRCTCKQSKNPRCRCSSPRSRVHQSESDRRRSSCSWSARSSSGRGTHPHGAHRTIRWAPQ
jgi:hypothetical protein